MPTICKSACDMNDCKWYVIMEINPEEGTGNICHKHCIACIHFRPTNLYYPNKKRLQELAEEDAMRKESQWKNIQCLPF